MENHFEHNNYHNNDGNYAHHENNNFGENHNVEHSDSVEANIDDILNGDIDDSQSESQNPNNESELESEPIILYSPSENGETFNWSEITSISQFVVDFLNTTESNKQYVATACGINSTEPLFLAKELISDFDIRYRNSKLIEFKEVFDGQDIMAAMRLSLEVEKMDSEDIRSIVRVLNSLNDAYGIEDIGHYAYKRNDDAVKVISRISELSANLSDEAWEPINWLQGVFNYLDYKRNEE